MAKLENITRRAALKLFSASGAAVAAPVAAVAATKTDIAPPADRMAHHLAEFQKAAQDADPAICGWNVKIGTDPESDDRIAVQITAKRRAPVRYNGKGTYLLAFTRDQTPFTAHVWPAASDWNGRKQFHVHIYQDGDIDKCMIEEGRLNKMIVGRVG